MPVTCGFVPSMILSTRPHSKLVLFAAAFLAALMFALLTRHAWEDYYITYRTSKNLATGEGLVFTPGEKLHTFTSPIGVLLPAVASLLTFNTSDAAALWIFRLMSAAAFGGTAVLLLGITTRLNYPRWVAFLPAIWLLLDAKSLDFTINGMETGFMLLFLTGAFYASIHPGPRQWIHLGIAWAGLMWTRPDSFVYVALIAAAFWIFNQAALTGKDRRGLLQLYLEAGLLTTVLYLPWLMFAYGYYGTPIPHTITAKGGIGELHTLWGFLSESVRLPFRMAAGYTSLESTFLPSYYMFPAWPSVLVAPARMAAAICYGLWLVPFLRTETRVASFVFFGAHAYLSYFPYFPFPWYVPSTALLAFIAYAGLFAQVWMWIGRRTTQMGPRRGLHWAARTTMASAVISCLGALWLTVQVGRQAAAQQTYVEDGNRRKIGEWLRDRAHPNDTVFLEPLGYIGFFSGLRTFDFPGMSSNDMVWAIRKVGTDWAALIRELNPNWLVLRPHEIQRIHENNRELLESVFKPVQVFDQSEAISRLTVNGRSYLEHDAIFTVFRRQRPTRFASENLVITSEFEAHPREIDGVPMSLIHAPGSLAVTIPAYAAQFQIFYGYPPDAYENTSEPTDGAVFRVELLNGSTRTLLFERNCDPVNVPEDRGVQEFAGRLPEDLEPGATLIFSTLAGESRRRDWTCWSSPEFL